MTAVKKKKINESHRQNTAHGTRETWKEGSWCNEIIKEI